MPLYDSLGENAVEFIINHSESSIVFVSKEKLGTLIKALPEIKKGLKTLVYWGNGSTTNAAAEKVRRSCGIASSPVDSNLHYKQGRHISCVAQRHHLVFSYFHMESFLLTGSAAAARRALGKIHM